MIFETKTITLKDGRAATLRAPALTDAAEMLAYIKTCCAETVFLSRYPEEYGDSIEAEETWIRRMVESPAVLPIVCEVEGRIAGSCEVRFLGGIKTSHRAVLGISVLREFWSLGIGTALMTELIAAGTLTGTVAAWAYAKKKNSIGWSEGSSVAWVTGLVATFGLVVAMFGIEIDFLPATFGLSAMIIPIAFIMNSVFPFTVYCGILTYVTCDSIYFSDYSVAALSGLMMFVAGLIFVFRQPHDDYRRKYSTWLLLISASVISVFLAEDTAKTAEAPTLLCMLLGILIALYASDNGERPAYPFRFICVPAISVILCALCVYPEDFITGSYYISSDPALSFPGTAPFVSAIIIALGIIAGKKSFSKNPAKTAFVILSSLSAALCTVCSVTSEFFSRDADKAVSIIITLISFAASITIIVAGIRKSKMLTVNLGLIMLCFLVYLTIFAGNFDIVYSGIACIIMGGILLFLNYRMSKSFKAKEAEKNA